MTRALKVWQNCVKVCKQCPVLFVGHHLISTAPQERERNIWEVWTSNKQFLTILSDVKILIISTKHHSDLSPSTLRAHIHTHSHSYWQLKPSWKNYTQTQKCAPLYLIIIIIIITVLKGAIQDFLQSPHCTTNCLQHVRSSGQGAVMCKSPATRPALITCNIACATVYEGTVQRIGLTEF